MSAPLSLCPTPLTLLHLEAGARLQARLVHLRLDPDLEVAPTLAWLAERQDAWLRGADEPAKGDGTAQTGLVLSGKLPQWLLGALYERLRDGNPWVALYDPQLDTGEGWGGAAVVLSELAALPVGTVLRYPLPAPPQPGRREVIPTARVARITLGEEAGLRWSIQPDPEPLHRLGPHTFAAWLARQPLAHTRGERVCLDGPLPNWAVLMLTDALLRAGAAQVGVRVLRGAPDSPPDHSAALLVPSNVLAAASDDPWFPGWRVALGGPAGVGKSTLSERLQGLARRLGLRATALRLSPDGEGRWTAHVPRELLRPLRQAAPYSDAFRAARAQSAQAVSRHVHLLLGDLGGRPCDEDRALIEAVDGLVWLGQTEEDFIIWDRQLERWGRPLPVLARLLASGGPLRLLEGPPRLEGGVPQGDEGLCQLLLLLYWYPLLRERRGGLPEARAEALALLSAPTPPARPLALAAALARVWVERPGLALALAPLSDLWESLGLGEARLWGGASPREGDWEGLRARWRPLLEAQE